MVHKRFSAFVRESSNKSVLGYGTQDNNVMQCSQARIAGKASPNLVALTWKETMSENTRSILGFRKKTLEAELLALQPTLMQEYIDTCSALLGIERSGAKHEISSTEFTPYRQAIDAMEAYLDKESEFKEQNVIVDALINGGFAPLDKKRRPNIIDSIRYHTNRSKRLAVKDGLIGKADWVNVSDSSPPGSLNKDH